MRNQTFKHNVIQEETYISTLRNTGKHIFQHNISHEKPDI